MFNQRMHAQAAEPEINQTILAIEARIELDLNIKSYQILESRLDTLRDLLSMAEGPQDKLSIHNVIAHADLQMSQIDKSKATINKAMKLVSEHRETLDQTAVERSYYNKALYLLDTGDYDQFALVMDTCFALLQTSDKEYYNKYVARAISMGYYTYAIGDMDECIDWQKKGLDIFVTKDLLNKKDSIQIAKLYNNVAYILWTNGDFDEVEPNFSEGLKYDSLNVDIRNNLIRFWDLNNRSAKAIKMAYENLEVIPLTNYFARGQNYSILVLANMRLYRASGDTNYFDKVFEIYDQLKSERSYSKETDYPFEANIAGVLSDFYIRIAHTLDVKKSEYYLDLQLELLKSNKYNENNLLHKNFTYTIKQRRANLMHRRGEHAEANQYINQFLNEKLNQPERKNLEPILNAKQLANSFNRYNAMNKQLNDLALSRESETPLVHLNRVETIYEKVDSSINMLLTKNDLDIEEIEFAEHNTIGIASGIYLYEHTKDKHYLDLVFQRFEKIRSLDLFRHHIQSKIKNSTDDDLATFKQSIKLKHQIDELEKEKDVIGESENKALLDSLISSYLNIKEKQGRNIENYHQLNIDILTLDDFQTKIDSSDVYLYVVNQKFAHMIFGLLVTNEKTVPLIIPYKDLEADLHNLLRQISNPEDQEYPVLLQKLYAKIISPIESDIASKDLIIGTVGFCSLIPFELLMDETKDYLGFKNTVSYGYSESWTDQLHRDDLPDQNGIYGFSTLLLNGLTTGEKRNYGNINAAYAEVNHLKNEYDAHIFTNDKATKNNFLKYAPEANIIHLAMHNDFNVTDPSQSHLIFSNKDADNLYLHEIDDLNLSADLLILSACNTGRGQVISSGNVISLARTFSYAGCNNILQTKWSVNDESTFHLMKRFYKNLDAGIRIPEALAHAMKDFYQEAPQKWKHPYYWGGFIFSGDHDAHINLSIKNSVFPPLLMGTTIFTFFCILYLCLKKLF